MQVNIFRSLEQLTGLVESVEIYDLMEDDGIGNSILSKKFFDYKFETVEKQKVLAKHLLGAFE